MAPQFGCYKRHTRCLSLEVLQSFGFQEEVFGECRQELVVFDFIDADVSGVQVDQTFRCSGQDLLYKYMCQANQAQASTGGK